MAGRTKVRSPSPDLNSSELFGFGEAGPLFGFDPTSDPDTANGWEEEAHGRDHNTRSSSSCSSSRPRASIDSTASRTSEGGRGRTANRFASLWSGAATGSAGEFAGANARKSRPASAVNVATAMRQTPEAATTMKTSSSAKGKARENVHGKRGRGAGKDRGGVSIKQHYEPPPQQSQEEEDDDDDEGRPSFDLFFGQQPDDAGPNPFATPAFDSDTDEDERTVVEPDTTDIDAPLFDDAEEWATLSPRLVRPALPPSADPFSITLPSGLSTSCPADPTAPHPASSSLDPSNAAAVLSTSAGAGDTEDWTALPHASTGLYESRHDPASPIAPSALTLRRTNIGRNMHIVLRDPAVPAAQKAKFLACLVAGKTGHGTAVGLEKVQVGIKMLGWGAERLGDWCERWAAEMELEASGAGGRDRAPDRGGEEEGAREN